MKKLILTLLVAVFALPSCVFAQKTKPAPVPAPEEAALEVVSSAALKALQKDPVIKKAKNIKSTDPIYNILKGNTEPRTINALSEKMTAEEMEQAIYGILSENHLTLFGFSASNAIPKLEVMKTIRHYNETYGENPVTHVFIQDEEYKNEIIPEIEKALKLADVESLKEQWCDGFSARNGYEASFEKHLCHLIRKNIKVEFTDLNNAGINPETGEVKEIKVCCDYSKTCIAGSNIKTVSEQGRNLRHCHSARKLEAALAAKNSKVVFLGDISAVAKGNAAKTHTVTDIALRPSAEHGEPMTDKIFSVYAAGGQDTTPVYEQNICKSCASASAKENAAVDIMVKNLRSYNAASYAVFNMPAPDDNKPVDRVLFYPSNLSF